jgi:T5SS/PEP-CTERM-associated repeat protein
MSVGTTGAAFFNNGGVFAAAEGNLSAFGTITLDGGTYTAIYGDVAVNFGGANFPDVNGVMTLTNGASLVMEPANPGNSLGFDIGVSFQTGYTAVGTLIIEAGSTLEARNTAIIDPGTTNLLGGFNNLNIGRGAGSSGYATVIGTGSRLTTDGGAARITVGNAGGYGALTIEQGGFVGTFNVTVGQSGGVGHLNIDGAGSELKTSSA